MNEDKKFIVLQLIQTVSEYNDESRRENEKDPKGSVSNDKYEEAAGESDEEGG
jgi:hypothetical protein